MGVTQRLSEFMPVPVVRFDGKKYLLDYNVPLTIGKVRSFYGVVPAVLRAYAWIMSLGSEGLKEVARVAVLNNNYVLKKVRKSAVPPLPMRKGNVGSSRSDTAGKPWLRKPE